MSWRLRISCGSDAMFNSAGAKEMFPVLSGVWPSTDHITGRGMMSAAAHSPEAVPRAMAWAHPGGWRGFAGFSRRGSADYVWVHDPGLLAYFLAVFAIIFCGEIRRSKFKSGTAWLYKVFRIVDTASLPVLNTTSSRHKSFTRTFSGLNESLEMRSMRSCL